MKYDMIGGYGGLVVLNGEKGREEYDSIKKLNSKK
jgi:hypothetical protein